MVNAGEAPVKTLEEVATAAAFEGFIPEDFAVFAVSGFAARMPLLKERIKPKLAQIGAALADRLSGTLGETLYPHVAQHLRRTVNPPEETWVAFARSSRAYKPFIHLRVAISETRVRVLAFVEDDADDKPRFAHNLARNADALADYLAHHPPVHAYELRNAEGDPLSGSTLDADTLHAFANRLQRIKGQHAVFGIHFADTHPVVSSGPELLEAVADAAAKLKPLYDCGAQADFTYTYVPEIPVVL